MNISTVYSKTAKGLTEARNGAKSLPKDHAKVLMMIDGQSSVSRLLTAAPEFPEQRFITILESLSKMGLIRALSRSAWDPEPAEPLELTTDGTIKYSYSSSLPTIEVTELSPQESVQAWAQARRGARQLEKKGFYTYGGKVSQSDRTEKRESLRALVVEDDEALSELLDVLLTNKGFSVRKAADIPGALAALQEGPPPDLVLLDVVLPGLQGQDGFHVLHHVRHSEELRAVPVIMVTSKVTDEYVMRGLKAGADGYIFKPFKWETLYASIKSVIGV